MEFIGRCIGELADLDVKMAGEDFLLTWDKSDAEIRATALVADALKALHRRGVSLKVFETGVAVSIFRDKSTRTRFSFASAANALGLALADLDEEKSQISHGETVRETANMIAFLSEVIGIRDDMYLGEGNRYMREVAAAVDEGFRAGVLHQRPAVVNLQCDIDHPTQTMADLLWLKEHFGSFEALRGKRIAMTWAYSPSYGKPLSVPQGIIGLMTRFGMDVVLAHPDGYNLIPEVEQVAATHATRSGGRYTRVASMAEAFRDADVVYPKSWAPYPVMQRRTELLKNRDKQGLTDLERDCLAQNAGHQDWECTDEMMKLTRGGAALYMHCLPADISGVSC
ncbi:MAG TPA: knotted carbamoyltransferase YgeW, partial [Acidobacteriota bacterium]|nr:knotted carbamoyltransferase YgeW [Acidobacteriota bacterium]